MLKETYPEVAALLANTKMTKGSPSVSALSNPKKAGEPEQVHDTLPPDIQINYDDFCAVFDRPRIDCRKRGRPRKGNGKMTDDVKLDFEMHRMLVGAPSVRQAKSAAEAARMLVDAGRISYLGRTGGIVTQGEQCAFAVAQCASV